MTASEENFEKVYVDLPGHWAEVSGESLWAKFIENDLYEIRNSPFYAYGINYLDVVRVDARAQENKLRVIEVVRPSGYQTIRIIFMEKTPEERRPYMLQKLEKFGVDWEGFDDDYVSLSIEPDGDIDALRDQLDEWEDED